MKKITIILTVLIAMSIKVNAQIPNNGFESWITWGSYQKPANWNTPQHMDSLGAYYPVIQSTDHYPLSVGSYSLELATNISDGMIGMLATNKLCSGCPPAPAFQITGHPTSFCGYFKWTPQNHDTLSILVVLFKNGLTVADAIMNRTDTVSSWTSFTLPISSYTTADSATILLTCFMASSSTSGAHGNSVLYVDNLSFDNLITSVSNQASTNNLFNIYPNPATDNITIDVSTTLNIPATIEISNIEGQVIKQQTTNVETTNFVVSSLAKGMYFVKVKTEKGVAVKKFIKE